MMSLDELKSQIDALDQTEFETLLEYMQNQRREARLKTFDEAVDALQAGLTREEIEEIKQALNVEYVEPVDVDQWRD